MATYWKEVVNFGGGFESVRLLLSVVDGVGVCTFDSVGKIESGRILLLTKERGEFYPFENFACEFFFETEGREYFVEIFEGEVSLCSGGNSQNLKSEFEVPKIEATDAFEARVADFNYYETELGEKGKTLEGILDISDVKEDLETPKTKTAENIENNVAIEGIKSEEVAIKTESETEKEEIQKPQQSKQKPATQKQSTQKTQSKKTQTAGRKTAKSKDFFSLAKPEVEKMLAKFPKEEFLEEMLENSRWVKIDFSKDASYAVGIIYADDLASYIGYAVKGDFASPPKFDNPQFVPVDLKNPNGEGYFLVFQRADSGEKV